MKQALLFERKTLKEQQEELWGVFLELYNRLASKRRVVLRFDTAEVLEYARDSEEVLEDCEVSPEDAPSWEWLLRRIGSLNNTAILIAARPTPTGLLKHRLLEAHKKAVLPLEVKEFAPEETKAYLQAHDFGREVAEESPDWVEKIQLLTEGRPILIALALDWLARGRWEPHIYPASLEQLQIWHAGAQDEERKGHLGENWQKWDETKRNFEIALVENIRSLDHTGLDVAVKYAALARKGCNAELLSLLMEISLEEAEQLVGQLLTLSFVKPPRGLGKPFFLHDEMYDLVERYIWLVDWPDYSEQARLDQLIIDWYTKQIQSLNESVKACKDWRERALLRRQQQLLTAERLWYQFDKDPRIGYVEYSHLDEEAIGAVENEWDIWLRNEALSFTSHRAWRQGQRIGTDEVGYPRRDPARIVNGEVVRSPAVDHDCRRRWVNRYIAGKEWEKAVRIATKLLQKSVKSRHPEEPELYRGGIRIGLATAQAYMGGEFTEAALRNFEEGIQDLINVPEEHKEPWLYPYLLGTAYLYRGLALRNSLRLSEAAHSYREATKYYRRIDYQPRVAEAMNNLAYIYARQGKPDRALDPCNEALGLREGLGDEYPIGLSLNTKGIIYERLGFADTACDYSRKALQVFRDISNERGIVLAEINLGRSLRRKGVTPEWRAPTDFREALRFLRDAISLLEHWGKDREVFYESEAYDELGCVYRDWVATIYEKWKRDPQRLVQYLRPAKENLEKARSLIRRGETLAETSVFQYVDVTEHLAGVYYWWAKLESPPQEELWGQALELLEEAKRSTESIRDLEEFPFLLGKIHYQHARIAREQGEAKRELAAKHYAKAAGLLEQYSLHLPELGETVADAADWLREVDSAEEAKRWIQMMKATLQEKGWKSDRLRDWIDDVVSLRWGVGWSQSGRNDQEAVDG
ncbi:MAG: tetratricopeptide repeat protein [Promethearchaeota archaeon]